MAGSEITQHDALMRLGASTAEAIAKVLEMFMPSGVERGEVTVFPEGATPFVNLPLGGVMASVHYVDGVTGANVFLMTPPGARALASAMGAGVDGEAAPELTELELSAIGEAVNQMLAAAAAAISVVLGQEVEISPPQTQILDEPEAAIEVFGKAPHACSTSFTIGGEPCRLIQLVPSAFVVRMARALDEMNLEQADDAGGRRGGGETDGPLSLTEALRDVNLRVWAELGRTRIALGQALELPIGAVVDLDRPSESPVELFVNGLCFGQGQLLVTDDGEWAIEIESLCAPAVRAPTPAGATPFHHQ
jgi:flagellar motor switch protein FliN